MSEIPGFPGFSGGEIQEFSRSPKTTDVVVYVLGHVEKDTHTQHEDKYHRQYASDYWPGVILLGNSSQLN